MREIILSDITEMGTGLCVIGLEQVGKNEFRSVRPMPPRNYAWPLPFGFSRGSFARFEAAVTVAHRPHVEDQNTHGLTSPGNSLEEDELVDLLQHAEVAERTEGLFGCSLSSDHLGGNAWVLPDSARRSICGCNFANMRFRVFLDADGPRLLVKVALRSGEVLHSLPVVDWAWRQFAAELRRRLPKNSPPKAFDSFFNGSIRSRIMDASVHFMRIGLPRAKGDSSKCWLMLDSLFPQPHIAWLNDL